MLIYQDADLRRNEIYVRSVDRTLALTPELNRAILRQFVLYMAVSIVFWARLLTGWRIRYTIGFVPTRPKPWYKIWNVTKIMGLGYSDDWAACDVLFYFEDKTTAHVDKELLTNSGKKVLNGRCQDTSKAHVEAVFEAVFGYSLAIDPLIYQGKAVRKSDENARHDGRIIDCPVTAREADCSYQRFIDNCYDGRMAEDIRVPIVGDTIPFVYLKRRPVDVRFANDNTQCAMIETTEALSEAEVAQLVEFAHRMGLDFGGLDVLRDRNDGRIYVVDVNKTDMGPPVPLTIGKKVAACGRLGRAFVDMIKSEVTNKNSAQARAAAKDAA